MSVFDLVIKGGVVLASKPENPFELVEERLDIGIQNGVIEELGSIPTKKAKKEFCAKNLHVLPGLIDCQVHFREPGMEQKENFKTGSLSALMGGITGVFEMPNTFPPTTSREALDDKRKRAKGRFYCDYAFFMGASPDNLDQIGELEKLPACSGVKVFMGSSTGSLLLNEDHDLEKLVQTGRRRIAAHCEDEARLIERKHFIKRGDPSSHALWRDEKTALIATEKLVRLAKKHRRPVHILHVTTAEEMEFLSRNKDIATVEATPQHLTLQAPSAYEQRGSLVQMNPPIRGKRHFEALWKALESGVVDIVGSDHAPHTLEEKGKPYPESPSGLPGVETLLPLLLHHRSLGRLDLKKIVSLLALNPHKYFKLKKRALIAKNFIANLTLVDINKTYTLGKGSSLCGWSPFEGMKIKGKPHSVFLHGDLAMSEGALTSKSLAKPSGREIEFE